MVDRRRGGARRAPATKPAGSSEVPEDAIQAKRTPEDVRSRGDVIKRTPEDAAWFAGSRGDLQFAQWMLGRCMGVGDARTPGSVEIVARVHALFVVQRRLRLELAMGSSSAAASENENENENESGEQEGEMQETSTATATAATWPIEDMVEEVARALRPARMALQLGKRKAEKANVKFEGGLEKIVVAEVVEHATELLLSRSAGGKDRELLDKWVALLSEELEEEEEQQADKSAELGEEGNATSSKKAKKNERKNKGGKDAERSACEQTAAFLAFVAEFENVEPVTGLLHTEFDEAALAKWTQELTNIYNDSRIDPADEVRRIQVAATIQGVLRKYVTKWSQCEVKPFGSSLSHFGSKNSDLDMCLIPKPNVEATPTQSKDNSPAVSSRQIRQLIKAGQVPEATDGNSYGTSVEPAISVDQLLELSEHATKSIEKLVQTLNSIDNAARKAKNGDESGTRKESKQQKQLEFFLDHWRVFHEAVKHELESLQGPDSKSDSVAAFKAAAAERQLRIKSLIAASRKRVDELYLVQAMLQRADCTIRLVIRGARIPIIKFVHTPTGFECDLCFENVLATRNTFLLRAYAEFDDRARVLGLAVKHWAKRRGISDASQGFFSAYTFVLLSIYFLQQPWVGVLPSLQDPELLKRGNQPREEVNGVDIAFCTNLELARAFHEEKANSISTPTIANASSAELLVAFFRFYANQFDFARDVVTPRDPSAVVAKFSKWGLRKTKTWRMSVEDPLETTRDLGCVLQFKGQEAILREFRRAHDLLSQGASFASVVCESATTAAESDPAAAGAVPNKRKNGKNEERAYTITIWSADRELSKPGIVALFKSFESSFRVGKIVDVRDKKNGGSRRKYEVELLTKAQQCPRALTLKTRVDWEETEVNGGVKKRSASGSVWIHHTALHNNAPCIKCLSPTHLERDCKEDVCAPSLNRHVLRVLLNVGHTRSNGSNSNQQYKERRDNRSRRNQPDQEVHEQHGDAGDSRHEDHKAPSKRSERRSQKDPSEGGSARSKKLKATNNASKDRVVRAEETHIADGDHASASGKSENQGQKKKRHKWQHKRKGVSSTTNPPPST